MRIYAIGDIHGHADKLAAAHALIAADRARTGDATAPVVHVGDLCDRGPDTRGVLDLLIAGLARGEPWHVLKGNHDRMMQWWLEAAPREDPHLMVGHYWLHPALGGVESLASYGVWIAEGERIQSVHARARAAVPEAHRAFIAGLPTSLALGECLFVHAGIRPGVALVDQTEEDLLWIRKPFHDSPDEHGALVVHGHTPVDRVTHYGNRLNLDTGAGYGKPLGVVVIEGRAAWRLTGQGRADLRTR